MSAPARSRTSMLADNYSGQQSRFDSYLGDVIHRHGFSARRIGYLTTFG